MLLDPFEEQFDLPAAAIELGDGERRKDEVVGQKDQRLSTLRVLEANAPQRVLKAVARVEDSKHNRLVADQPSRAIDRVRVAAAHLEVGLAAGHEVAARPMQPVQTLEIDIAPIHDIERARFGQQSIEDIDFVHLAVADMNKRRNIAAQIEQRVQLDRAFGRTEGRPGKHRQTQIDGGRVQRVHRILQIDAEGFVGVKRPRNRNQALRIIGIDAPVAHRIGVGQSVARHRRAKSQMIELARLRTQAGLEIAQALPIGELREGHGEKLVQARKRFDLALAPIVRHATAKGRQRQMLHHLRKHQLALIHCFSPRSCSSQGRSNARGSSNRDQDKSPLVYLSSTTYTTLQRKRWDTTERRIISKIYCKPIITESALKSETTAKPDAHMLLVLQLLFQVS